MKTYRSGVLTTFDLMFYDNQKPPSRFIDELGSEIQSLKYTAECIL